ncbi:MAG: hypothetical protein K8H99_12805 [Nitrospirae bacterium]|nr:hypothetical protein [Fimbriimonadaceae bacterium]
MAAIPRSISVGLTLGLVLVLALGCVRTWSADGEWLGQREVPVSGLDPAVAKSLGLVKLTIRDGRFELLEAGIPKEGSVRYDPDRALLHVEKYMGRPMDQAAKGIRENNVPLEIKPGHDGTLLFHDPKGFDREPLVLKKG